MNPEQIYGYVECKGGDGHFCGAHGDDEEDARRIWNTRAQAERASMAEEIERAVEAAIILRAKGYSEHADALERLANSTTGGDNG